MDGKTIMKGLLTGLTAIGLLLAGAVAIIVSMFVVGIVVGILFGLTDDLGFSNTSTAYSFLENVSTAFYEFAGYLISALGLVGVLITVVIVILVFGGLIGGGVYLYKKNKGGMGGSSY